MRLLQQVLCAIFILSSVVGCDRLPKEVSNPVSIKTTSPTISEITLENYSKPVLWATGNVFGNLVVVNGGYDEPPDLLVIKFPSLSYEILPIRFSYPAWSPDGTKIIGMAKNEHFVYDTLRKITRSVFRVSDYYTMFEAVTDHILPGIWTEQGEKIYFNLIYDYGGDWWEYDARKPSLQKLGEFPKDILVKSTDKFLISQRHVSQSSVGFAFLDPISLQTIKEINEEGHLYYFEDYQDGKLLFTDYKSGDEEKNIKLLNPEGRILDIGEGRNPRFRPETNTVTFINTEEVFVEIKLDGDQNELLDLKNYNDNFQLFWVGNNNVVFYSSQKAYLAQFF